MDEKHKRDTIEQLEPCVGRHRACTTAKSGASIIVPA